MTLFVVASRRTLILLALAGAFGLFAYWWLDGGRYRFKPRRFGVVQEGAVYRSGQIHPNLIRDVLTTHGIDVIIDLAQDPPHDEAARAEHEAAKALGVRMVSIQGLDGNGIGPVTSYVEALTALIQASRQGEQVLVHCAAGSQRTGAAIAWYRLLVQRWSGPHAYEDFEKYQRWHARNELVVPYVNRHMGTVATALVKAGLVPSVPDPLPRFGP